jgi:hypothetical protein
VVLGAARYSHIYISHMLGSWLGQKARGFHPQPKGDERAAYASDGKRGSRVRDGLSP